MTVLPVLTFCYRICQYCASNADKYKHTIAMYDIGPLPKFVHPANKGVCQVCQGRAATPFTSCNCCLDRPAWHEGRCCPFRDSPQAGSVQFRKDQYAALLRAESQGNRSRAGSRANSRANSRSNSRANSRQGSGGSSSGGRYKEERDIMRRNGTIGVGRTNSPNRTPRGSQSGVSASSSGRGANSSGASRTITVQSLRANRANRGSPSSCCKKSKKSMGNYKS